MVRLQLPIVVQLFCLIPSLVSAQYAAYNYGFDVSRQIKRQAPRRQVLVVKGDVQLRQEIRQLERDQDLWTLYILGLSMMQYTAESSPTSWYGIAGIHGAPFRTWGGVEPTGSTNFGYCTHSSVLFPTWHRPYMALYEQVLYNLIQTIATFWPDNERQRFQDAARRFRIPYWDWAASPPPGESILPASVGGSPFIDVRGPNGLQRIANPLFSYTFKPNATSFNRTPWNFWGRTLRGPSDNGPNAQSNNSQVAFNLDRNRPSIAQRLYTLFSHDDDYRAFSNNAFQGNSLSFDSLESLHDTVHYLAGGGGSRPNEQSGHMSYIPYSAFDPIFFLHHCMVDRIFALWQTLHPETWVTPTPALQPTYTTREGQIQNASSALTPFFSHENGTFWTSDGVRDHTRFGYTYGELVPGPTAGGRAQARVRQAINRLYGGDGPANLFLSALRSQGLEANREMIKVGVNEGSFFRSGLEQKIFEGDQYREWAVNIRVEKDALGGPFSIHLFLGEPPLDPKAWTSASSHIGTMGVFAHSHSSKGPMRKMRRKMRRDGGVEEGVWVTGSVPLTAALMKKVAAGELASMQPVDVEPYLKKNLDKRVLGPFGRTWGLECAQVLKFAVVSSVVRAPYSESELPEWEAKEVHSKDWEASDDKGREEGEEGRCGLGYESGDDSDGEGHGHDEQEWDSEEHDAHD